MIYTNNHGGTLEDLADVVNAAVLTLRPKKKYFDSIVVRGVSGMIVGSPVALKLKKPLVVIRKPNENSHSGNSLVVNLKNIGSQWLFLDDFIVSGATKQRCIEAIEAFKEYYFGDIPTISCQYQYAYDKFELTGR